MIPSRTEFLNLINKKYYEFYKSPSPVKIIFGGRHSGKSFFGALLCLYLMIYEGKKIYAFRYSGKTAERDLINLFLSVLNDLLGDVLVGKDKTKVDILYYSSLFKFALNQGDSFIVCRGKGSETEDLKSFGGIDFVWIDEATNFSNFEMQTLLTSIMGRSGECGALLTSNIPVSKKHWIYKMFIGNENSVNYKYLITNFKDNPYINHLEIEKYYNETYFKGSSVYLREVLGIIPDSSQNNLIPKFDFKNIDEKFNTLYVLIKFQLNSVSVLICSARYKDLYILHELHLPLIRDLEAEKEHLNNFIKHYLSYIQDNVFIYYYSKDFRAYSIIESIFDNEQNIITRISDILDLKDFKIFSSSFINLVISDKCVKFKRECEDAEWIYKEENDAYMPIVKDFYKFNFLDTLRLIKFKINNLI